MEFCSGTTQHSILAQRASTLILATSCMWSTRALPLLAGLRSPSRLFQVRVHGQYIVLPRTDLIASTCTRRPSGSSNVPSTTPGPTGIPSPSTTPGPTNGTFTYNTPTLKPSNSTGPTATPDAVDQASLLILNNGLGRFCSEYLGYDKLATTTTEIGSEVTTVVTSLVDGTGPAVLVTVIRTETIDNVLTQASTPTVCFTASQCSADQTDFRRSQKSLHRLI